MGDGTSRTQAGGNRSRSILIGAVILVIVVGLGVLVSSLMGKSDPGPKRQTVKIAVLPDSPPPPPPPKPEEKKPEPKPEENKPQPQEQPKPVEAPPEPQQLKMDGPAGDGPSAFAAGNVSNEYKGGDIGGGTGGGSGGPLADRMSAMTYGNAAKRELNEYLNREPALRQAKDYRLPVSLWVRADGTIERYELAGSAGTAAIDDVLRAVLERFPGFRSAPPQGLKQPMRLQITNRVAG